MGLFDQVLSAAGSLSGQQGQGNNALLDVVMQLVNNPQTGGLAGLIQSFQSGGLGEIVKSWVSTGQNLPVSAEQIQSALGSEQISNLAAQSGVSPEQMSGHLAQFLPQIIDTLTPDGSVPQEGDLMAQGMALLKGKLLG